MKRVIKIISLVLVGIVILSITVRLWNRSKKLATSVSISLPHTFKTEKAEQLSIQAFDLQKSEEYYEAINLYQQAIEIEPDNPKLFLPIRILL